jgi:hypothetical protein
MSFKITSSHTTPVPAGTVVVFSVEPPKGQNLTSQQVDVDDYDWHILGPFSGTARSVAGGPTFDWDTQGLRAGAYTVYAVRTRSGGAAAGDSDAGDSDAGSATTSGSAFNRGGTGGGGGGSTGGAMVRQDGGAQESNRFNLQVTAGPAASQDGIVPVSLQRTAMVETADQALWVIIRNRTDAIAFNNYRAFIDGVMATDPRSNNEVRGLTFRGPDAYNLLKFATDAFLLQETGVLDPYGVVQAGFLKPGDPRIGAGLLDPDRAMASIDAEFDDPARQEAIRLQEKARLGRNVTANDLRRLRDAYYIQLKEELSTSPVLPYLRIIRDRLSDIPLKEPGEVPASSYGILRSHLTAPLAIELIWSYWLEEGQLAQTLNAVLARFQNRSLVAGRPDPLARLNIDPLRPLANVFWGWMQDEIHRLTVRRRDLEYLQGYGLKLLGKAVPSIAVADRRTRFLEAFHNLLFLCHVFFKEDDDTTVIADGFPVLNALRETHLLLAEGAHNQFGDLPSTARAEMLVMEWLLARPEMRDFLGGRVMVPYEEAWMDRVDSMKSMQGWTDVSITHFRDMAVFGEQILLSVRYGNWSVENNPQTAANWARYWRPEIQRYVHAYRSATGADLTERVDATMPGILLRRRLALSSRRAALDGQRPAQLGGRPQRIPGVITRRDEAVRRELP